MCVQQAAFSGALSCPNSFPTWATFSRCLPGLGARDSGLRPFSVVMSISHSDLWRSPAQGNLLPAADSAASSSLGGRVTRFLQPPSPGSLPGLPDSQGLMSRHSRPAALPLPSYLPHVPPKFLRLRTPADPRGGPGLPRCHVTPLPGIHGHIELSARKTAPPLTVNSSFLLCEAPTCPPMRSAAT